MLPLEKSPLVALIAMCSFSFRGLVVSNLVGYNYAMNKNDMLNEAISFAAEAHKGAIRKLDKSPYILHPMETCVIAGTMTDDVNILAAALLHDTIEDAGVKKEEIREKFGDRVAQLVCAETETKSNGWKKRKEDSIEELKKTTDLGVKIIWLSDKLSNLRSFVRMWRVKGAKLWDALNQNDPAQQAWYYMSVADALRDMKDFEAYKEYKYLLKTIFTEYFND